MHYRTMGSQYDSTGLRAIALRSLPQKVKRYVPPQRFRGLGGFAGTGVDVPASVIRDAKHAGFLSVVIPVRVPAGLSGFGITAAGGASLIGAGASMVKTRNPVTSMAAQGASAGASIGSVIPVIGTVIGAAVGAVLGAIGGAFMGSKRPESELWDNYKKLAGKSRGIEYDNAFRNGAFVGLFRLGKNTFPPRQSKYGPNDDKKFLDDMAAKIGEAVRAGKIGAEDDAKSIFEKVVYPWTAEMGDWSKPPPDWQVWDKQILIDLIDAYIYDLPIVATSYTESRKANPSISEVVKSLPTAAPVNPAPAVTPPSSVAPAPVPIIPPVQLLPGPNNSPAVTSRLPAGVYISREQPVARVAPDNAPVYQASDNKLYIYRNPNYFLYDGPAISIPSTPAQSTPLPVQTLPAPAPIPAPVVTPTNTGPVIDVAALVQSLADRGASSEQAFAAALQALQSQGVATTPAVQQQVAEQVAATSGTLPSWALPAMGIAALGFIFYASRGKRARS